MLTSVCRKQPRASRTAWSYYFVLWF